LIVLLKTQKILPILPTTNS